MLSHTSNWLSCAPPWLPPGNYESRRKMQKVVKFFLKPCALRDIEVNAVEPFNFVAFMNDIKAKRYFQNDVVFIPYEQIAAVMYAEPARLQDLSRATEGLTPQ